MVAIDLTGVAFKWLENGTLNYYHYTVATHWPLPLEQFMEIVCKSLFIWTTSSTEVEGNGVVLVIYCMLPPHPQKAISIILEPKPVAS